MEPVTLAAGAVVLEPLSFEHVPDLVRAATEDRRTYELTVVPHDEASAQAYVAEAMVARERGAQLPFAVRFEGRVVGSTRFGSLETWPGHDHVCVAEIGWTWYAASAQRTACNTQAKRLLLTHAFESWRVHRLFLKTDARNQRSRAAIVRLGARFEGVLRHLQPAADHAGPRDTAVYSILPDEWPDVRDRLAVPRSTTVAAPVE